MVEIFSRQKYKNWYGLSQLFRTPTIASAYCVPHTHIYYTHTLIYFLGLAWPGKNKCSLGREQFFFLLQGFNFNVWAPINIGITCEGLQVDCFLQWNVVFDCAPGILLSFVESIIVALFFVVATFRFL